MQPSRAEIVERARAGIGSVGAVIGAVDKAGIVPWPRRLDGLLRLEAAGYPAAWSGEGVGGKDAFVEMALMLAATQRMAIGSATASIWARPAATANAAGRMLASAYPGRFLVTFGVGYPPQAERAGLRYERPAKTMENYLADMATERADEPLPDHPRLVGANGPKMIEVASRCADGAIAGVAPPLFVQHVREVLGPDKLVGISVPFIGEPDRATAQKLASEVMKGVAGFPGSPYGANLLRLGYSEDDLKGPSDRLRDDVVAYGPGEDIARLIARYLSAGADHVLLAPMTSDYETAVGWLESIAPDVLSRPAA